MATKLEGALDYSARWIELIRRKDLPDEAEGKRIIEESRQNFAEHFNRGWLEYRKSVTEAGDWAAVEWTGSGAVLVGVLGRAWVCRLGVLPSSVTAMVSPSVWMS